MPGGKSDVGGANVAFRQMEGDIEVRSQGMVASVRSSSLGGRNSRWVSAMAACSLMVLCALAPRASAADGVEGYWGNTAPASGAIGGEFFIDNMGPEGRYGPMGVGVNDTSGDVYVADPGNNRVQQFSEDGDFIRTFGVDVISTGASNHGNEIQSVMVNAGAGQFKLSFGADTTGDLAFNASATQVAAALNGLPSISAGGGGVTVAGGPGGPGGTSPYVVFFDAGPLAGVDVPELASAAGTTPLSGGTGSGADAATVSTFSAGEAEVGFEICDATAPSPNQPADCKAGLGEPMGGGMSAPKGVAVNQATGDVYVVDEGFLRVDQFTAEGVWLRSWGQDVIASGPHDNGVGFEICTAADVCQFGSGSDTTGGAFRSEFFEGLFGGNPAVVPAGLANAGNVLVPDPANARVQEFTAAGAFVRAFGLDVTTGGSTTFEVCTVAADCQAGTRGQTEPGAFSDRNPQRVAVDGDGAIYTVDGPGEFAQNPAFRVQKFLPSSGLGLAASEFAPTVLSGTCPGGSPTDIAVDPVDNHVFVAKYFGAGEGAPPAATGESRVLELDESGTLLDTHLVGAGLNPPTPPSLSVRYPRSGLAVRAGGGTTYVTATNGAGAPRVFRLGAVPAPVAALDEITDVTLESATVHGSVNPNGGRLETSYRIEYSRNGRDWTDATGDVPVGNGATDVPIDENITGLPSNVDLLIRIVATKPFNSGFAATAPLEIRTSGAPPLAQTGRAWWNGSAELVLSGSVHPRNANTTYYFEFGPTASYGSKTPVNLKGRAGDGGVARTVQEQLYGLATDSPIHYRVVATNASGTATGSDRVIASHDESYVYELVTDGESNGLGVLGVRGISDDGQRVAVAAQTLGDPPSLPSQTNGFIALRGASRWSIPSIGPDPAVGSGTAIAQLMDLPTDLSAVLFPQRSITEAMAQEGRWVRSRIDGTSDPVSPLLAPVQVLEPSVNQGNQFVYEGGSSDLSTFVFKKVFDGGAITYLPGEPLVRSGYADKRQVNIYQVDSGGSGPELSLVNRDAANNPISNVCGAWVGSEVGTGMRLRPVSADGSVVYFGARPGAPTTGTCNASAFRQRVFKRVNGTSTVPVSESQCTRVSPTPCSPTDGDDAFQGASADGEVVLFTSTRQLTNSDEDATKDLYLYDADPPAGQPTLVQASAGEVTASHPQVGSGAAVQGVTTVAADGSRVYFVANGQLTGDAPSTGPKLFVFERSDEHPGGRIEFVAALSQFLDSFSLSLFNEGQDSRKAWALPFRSPSGGPGDGHILAFASFAALLPAEDQDFAADLYRYNDETDELTCISCAGDGLFNSVVLPNGFLKNATYAQESRVGSEDGSAFAFATTEAILPEDENLVQDAYIWRNGQLSLVSGSVGTEGIASEALISAGGDRAFFLTKAVLNPSDRNSGLDVYAASIGGGLPLQRPGESPCEDGDSCRGGAPPPPPVSPPVSRDFSGPGNVTPKKPCKKPKVKRKGRCVKPKASRKHKAGKRTGKSGNHNSRGGNR